MHKLYLLLAFLTGMLISACVSEAMNESIEVSAAHLSQTYQEVSFSGVKATREEKTACDAAGGTVHSAGRLGAEYCIQELPDAGKSCSDASDCLGRCVLEGHDAHRTERGTKTTGVCEQTNEVFGCTTLVTQGEVEGTVCID